jgi:adenylate cyclase
MRIIYSYKDIFEDEILLGDEVIVGRTEMGVAVDVDLRFDRGVSHRHARIWLKEGQCYVEDLGSRNGTLINGENILARGSRHLREEDVISVGDTRLHVKMVAEPLRKNPKPSSITLMLDAKKPVYSVLEEAAQGDAERRLAILYELPLQFGGQMRPDSLLQMIVSRLIECIPASARAALVLTDPLTNTLLLKAHVPPGEPCVSMTLAHRALEQRVGFIWQREVDPDVTQTDSMADCAMYAPLLWNGQALGVAVLDNYQKPYRFGDNDLRLLMAVAQHAAMAVANQLLQEELRRESAIKSNLLRQFSPKIAERLLKHRGRLPLGGQRSEVTILFADIRGFSKLSRDLEPEDIVELLNCYFSALTSVVFFYDGSVVQYVGDTILSVFGSPEPDSNHYEQAVHAALKMQERMYELNSTREAVGKITCNIGIGVHCGEIVHGFVGMPDSMGFSVIGDAVNRTARYCAGAKEGEVLVSSTLYERVWRIIPYAEAVTIDAKFNESLSAYRVTNSKREFGK